MRPHRVVIGCLATLACVLAPADRGPLALERLRSTQPQTPAWVERSNGHAQVLLDVLARFSPEGAGGLGVQGLDEQISDLSAESLRRQIDATAAARTKLEQIRQSETHPLVLQDLEILIESASEGLRGAELARTRLVPYTDVVGLVYSGVRRLLDLQVAPERRAAALVRLRKYAGQEKGFEPASVIAARRTRERLNDPKLLPPARPQVERDLANAPILLEGIEKLFQQYGVEGWREPFDAFRAQAKAYEEFVRKDVLPRSRTDFRLPADLYAFSLDQVGIGVPREEVAAQARAAYVEIQKEMDRLAPQVAKDRNLTVTGYRDVIRALKKEQLVGDAILAHYRTRLEQIEAIIRRERLVTLPTREARIRIASDAEAAASPAPNMRPPRLIGNTGELGEFVLPLNIPASPGSTAATQQFDDFTFEAASWTLTAHEARPGHEMQFARMIEAGVSTARAIFAFNSTNVEGWGLYAEWMMLPHMPSDGQLISLQFRLMRAARAFLDPELHMGRISPDEARRILREEVVLSPAMTEQEVERYMFRAPAQATSYFYGYTQLRELRRDVERRMGDRFEPRAFHDFVLAQGLLPPALLREAVMARFVEAAP
jgi:hypothetical protein